MMDFIRQVGTGVAVVLVSNPTPAHDGYSTKKGGHYPQKDHRQFDIG